MPYDPLLGPDPDALHPIPAHPRVMFARNLPLPPNVEIGAYSYYDDPDGPVGTKTKRIRIFFDNETIKCLQEIA